MAVVESVCVCVYVCVCVCVCAGSLIKSNPSMTNVITTVTISTTIFIILNTHWIPSQSSLLADRESSLSFTAYYRT